MLHKSLSFIILIISLSLSLSSKSILRKSIQRRQSDLPYCDAIESFECKCSSFRVTCTTTRDLSSPINILENEKHKYQSVELVIAASLDIKVNDQTFEPIKQLYKNDPDSLEFRVKFEKFTGLHLSSSGIFNRVFPDNLSSNIRKHMALEIYNPEVAPSEDLYLFKNLNVDALEVYALYPFHGSFQQLFDGANIKYLRLSGGDIRSDLSKTFTGNIARLELAKQASALSVQNFPIYPAHELIINAFYITDFNNEYPPNYSNLGELLVYSTERIPANAFQQFPNIHTLSITTDRDIDPKALHGLNHLEKLTIKEARPSITLLNSQPSIKEFETNVEKLDEEEQCQLISKLADGQVAVQTIPTGRECTCIIAYLNSAVGRTPCDIQDCDRSTCSAIKNNYDPTTHLFKSPPSIQRADGTDALHQRQSKVYTTSYQVLDSDREKLHLAIPQHSQQEHDNQTPSDNEQHGNHEKPDTHPSWSTSSDVNHVGDRDDEEKSLPYDYSTNREYDQNDKSQSEHLSNEDHSNNFDRNNDQQTTKSFQSDDERDNTTPVSSQDEPQTEQDQDDNRQVDEQGKLNEGGDNQREEKNNENQTNGENNQAGSSDSNVDSNGNNDKQTDGSSAPPKKGMNWLPIIIIAAAILTLLLIGITILVLRKRNTKKGYGPTATNDLSATTTATARA
ncbi:unnamed protein product [Rotaria magnacalcarata]|uniref:Uncharacterized protein n=3 Tax=Rotaria magnacalcarata TaxID=392030 RepID=A0A819CIV9_9BILA|nr:unnamed protein product [Rotaria magnacalcarata]CAF3821393.1 unnamed protein product [Rotaria magnacalcarata]